VLDAFVGLAGDPKFRRLLVSQPKAVAARAEAWAKVLERVLEAPPQPGDGDSDDEGEEGGGGAEEERVFRGVGGAEAEARAEDAESWAGLD
jgi:hypothetical protein